MENIKHFALVQWYFCFTINIHVKKNLPPRVPLTTSLSNVLSSLKIVFRNTQVITDEDITLSPRVKLLNTIN